MPMTQEQFEIVRAFAFREVGITLEDGKEYLVESRLRPVLKAFQWDMDELMAKLRMPTPEVREAMIDAMTINETSFFRDRHPFDALRNEILPELYVARSASKRLRILSAASSTGQEAYSLAMMIADQMPQFRDWDVKIVGGDISDDALEKARAGRYTQMEVNRGLPASMLIKHFEQHDAHWMISDRIKSLVEFRKLNLTKPWIGYQDFDVVLCRNVLIYFDLPTRNAVLNEATKAMKKDGYLFLGASETLLSLETPLEMHKTGATRCYRQRSMVTT